MQMQINNTRINSLEVTEVVNSLTMRLSLMKETTSRGLTVLNCLTIASPKR